MDLEDHVLGDFKQVAHNVIKCLQRKPCLPHTSSTIGKDIKDNETEDKDGGNSEEEISWSLPTSCVVKLL